MLRPYSCAPNSPTAAPFRAAGTPKKKSPMNHHYILFLLLLILGSGCADIQPLTGGERDMRPPALDSQRYSTPNRQTNFAERDIILTFDEWILLEQAQQRILISPPLGEPKPQFKLKNKSLVIRLRSELRENTTYTINVGDAVKDLTEGNKTQNISFVFSTGAYIDSLRLTGKVVDALTTQGREGVYVMLYDVLEDSMPRRERPYYLAKTNKEGEFAFENIKADTFKIFALTDKNSNYLFDQEGEEVGFYPLPFELTDSTRTQVQLSLFAPESAPKMLSNRFVHRGLLRILYNQKIDSFALLPLSPLGKESIAYTQVDADSAYVWLRTEGLKADSSYQFLVQPYGDTLRLAWSSTLDTLPAVRILAPASASKGMGKNSAAKNQLPPLKQSPFEPMHLRASLPLSRIDTSLVRCYRDTILADSLQKRLPSLSVDSLPLRLHGDWAGWTAGKYQLVFLPLALTDIYGRTNADTIRQTIDLLKTSDLGNLVVTIKGLDTLKVQNYIFQLLRGKDEVLLSRPFASAGIDSAQFSFPKLVPASYTARIIVDNNNNGKWDTGDYDQKRQPERVLSSRPSTLRADWDNELDLNLQPPAKAEKKMKGGG